MATSCGLFYLSRVAASRVPGLHRLTWAQGSRATWRQPCAPVRATQVLLGIESSCDDTGAAVVTSDGKILGEALASQAEVHAQWGGVVPNLAQEAHSRAIDQVVADALASSGVEPSDLDAVAVTIGPGLGLCLRVGVLKAHQVAARYRLRLVPVHHMEAHALVVRLSESGSSAPRFPFVCLLVSGGHNLLLFVRGVGDYQLIGTTLDDAVGEAYDKVARLLGLPLTPSGGPALEALAATGDAARFPLPVALAGCQTCDFSYAGLKNAARLVVEAHADELAADAGAPCQVRADIAASFQRAAVAQLEDRVRRGLEWLQEASPRPTCLVVSGGVAANKVVRAALDKVAEGAGVRAVYPPARLCTDNGVMVAWAGLERLRLGLSEDPPDVELPTEGAWVDVRSRWPLTTERHPRCPDPPNARRRPHRRHPEQRRVRVVHESLTELTRAQLAGRVSGAHLRGAEVGREVASGPRLACEQKL